MWSCQSTNSTMDYKLNMNCQDQYGKWYKQHGTSGMAQSRCCHNNHPRIYTQSPSYPAPFAPQQYTKHSYFYQDQYKPDMNSDMPYNPQQY